MTASAGWHLPAPDDASFQRALDALEDEGLDLSPRRRTVLATVKEFGLFDGPDGILGILRDAMVATTPEVRAAHARRVIRDHQDAAAAAEAKYHRSIAPSWDRTYRVQDNNYTCLVCGYRPERPFVDAAQAADEAADHAKTHAGGGDRG